MSRYRKTEIAMWGDGEFRDLTAPDPNAQTLWIYLLTGPHTSAIPGVIIAREETLAAELNWPMKGFREAFLEIENKGMAKADWSTGFVVLEKALLDSSGAPRGTNKPGNPNVFNGWGSHFDELPDCELKSLVLSRLESLSKGLGKAFQEAFRKGFRKALAKASTKPFAKALPKVFAQEQEQEQEGSASTSSDASGPVLFPSEPKRDPAREIAAIVCTALNAATGSTFEPTAIVTRDLARTLVKKRATQDDAALVVAWKIEDWIDDTNMRGRLVPSTLLAAKNFFKYLDEARNRAPSTPQRTTLPEV